METAQAVCSYGPILTLKPFHKKKFAVLTTGNEVYYHRIEDTFTPVIQEKLAEFGAEMIFHEVTMMMHRRSQTDAAARWKRVPILSSAPEE